MSARADRVAAQAADVVAGTAEAEWGANWSREWAEELLNCYAIIRDLTDDFDRRRSGAWGRFLLWLLRRTT